ncbi:epithelial cell transforming sequence 2 oncoprotein-like, partial [Rhizopus stolonifer]
MESNGKEGRSLSIHSQAKPPSLHASTLSTSRPCSISTYSSNTSSVSDPYSMSFLTDNQTYYNQIVEDISVIDNVCDLFEEEHEYVLSGKVQVLDSARHVVYKQQVISQIIQSETIYVNELYDFQDTYPFEIRSWLDSTDDKETEVKLKTTSIRKTLDSLFQILNDISAIHANFLRQLSERFQIWGPTQLISDIFSDFYKSLDLYETFFAQHPEFVVALDILYRLPAFSKFLETKVNAIKQRQSSLKIADMSYYLELPVNRTSYYCKVLHQLKNYSDTSNPDYAFLGQKAEKFRLLNAEWSERKKSCQAHLAVLESSRTIINCPVTATLNRRLIRQSDLIKVDLDDLSGTSDVRTYFLYSDLLIFCKKQKGSKKLTYKGSLSLSGAEVRHLQPALLLKMAHVKKPLFRIGKKSDDCSSSPEAFGFEVITTEASIDAVAPMYFSNGSLPPQMASGPVRR